VARIVKKQDRDQRQANWDDEMAGLELAASHLRAELLAAAAIDIGDPDLEAFMAGPDPLDPDPHPQRSWLEWTVNWDMLERLLSLIPPEALP
jgi:hypothetical protein